MKLLRPSLLNYLGWNTQGDLGPYTFYTTKRKKTVWFLKAPPTCPPSWLQTHNRYKFKLVAEYWHRHTAAEQTDWELASKRLNLSITGYNLFTWFYTIGDRTTLATIERLANLTLIADS